MAMGQMGVVAIFLLTAVAAGSSNLRDPPGPSYMSHAGAAEELAEKRHNLGIAKGKFLADIYNDCTVKYRDAKHIADLVKEKAGMKIASADREAGVFDAKVAAATKADNVKDPVSNESPKMKWMDHRDNKKAEVVFFKQIIGNANTVNKDGARGLGETTGLKKKVEGEFNDLDKWVVPKEAQSDDAERVIEDARRLWKQWTDSSKDYNCGIVQPVDHAKTQCKKGNTKFGIKCAVVCVAGYDDPNDSKNNLRCRKEGKFGKQLYGEWKGMATCVGRMCGLPAKIEKAKTVIQKIRYPHKATYNCYSGFSQDGNAKGSKAFEIPCTTTGNFDQNSSHVCKPVKCGEAPVFAGTEKVAGTFYFSNILNYKCKVGYTLDATAGGLTSFTTSCQATGRFSQGQICKRVRCGTAPDYDSTVAKRVNDKAQVCARSEGKTCRCNGVVYYGRKFVSGKPGSGKTTVFGQLKAITPTKQKQVAGEIACDNQAMGGDPSPGYYKWCYCQKAVEKKYGDQVDYTCNRGYSLNQKAAGKKAFTLTCGADGEFNLKGSLVPAIPQCRPVSAGVLPLVKYGDAKQREMFFGQSVTVTAEIGYSTSGKPTDGLHFLVGVSDRGFFVGMKEFIPVNCGAVPTVKKAKTSFAKPKGVYADILSYACEDGYSTDKSDSGAAKTFSVQCESDADFSRVPNLGYCTNIDDCIGHSCGAHGSCVDHLKNYTCKCDSGFEQTQNNETNELVCGNINDCGAEACGVGKCKDLVNGFDCICPTGFEVVGDDEDKTCKPVECGNPPKVNNCATAPVDAADNKAIYKDKITYRCDEGYTLDGSFPSKNQFSIDCQSNKRFTAKKSCNPVKCGAAPTIEHASKSPGTATFNDTIRYTCKDGYTIDATAKGDHSFSLTCLANGQYSEEQKCRPVNCGEPEDAANSNRPEGSLTYKQSAAYKCFEGFTLNGKKDGKTDFKVSCNRDGSLDKLKDCLPKVCGVPHKRINAMHATTADEGAVAYPRSTQVTCRPGYTVGGSPAGNTSFNVACMSSGDFEEYDKRECDPVRCSAPPPMPNATLDRVWSPHAPSCLDTAVFVTSHRGQRLEDRHGVVGVTNDKGTWQHWLVSSVAGKLVLTSHRKQNLEDREGKVGLHSDKLGWQQWTITDAVGGDLQGPLKTKHDARCLDYNYNNKNVYMHGCHDGKNQEWYLDGASRLRTKHDDKCLDYNYNNKNVYMHRCHGGKNQQWYFDDAGRLKTKHDGNCLDYNYNNKNVYMHGCHDGKNQKWFFDTKSKVLLTSHRNQNLEDRHGNVGLHVDKLNWQQWAITTTSGKSCTAASFNPALNYEEKAFYKCKAGFSVGGEPSAPKSITVECLPSGQISAPPDDMQCRNIDDCERHTCGPKGTCMDLIGPSPAYTCKCEHGFDLRTKPNGEKHCGNTDDCKDRDCGEGVCRDLVGDYTCICPSGYFIGKKDGVKTCVPIRCAASTPSLTHGKQTTSHSGAIDFPTTLQYKCDKGYSIDGTVAASKRNFQAQCKPTGQIAGMMSCQKISCGSPYVLSFTNLVSPASAQASIEYDEEVKYKCADGYSLHKNGRGAGPTEFTVTCPDDGVLTDPKVCEPVLCGSAPHVSHGHASVSGDVFYGMHLEYMCGAGYTSQRTKFQRRCQKDGTFSALPSDKPCKPVSGGRAPTIQNAAMTEYAGRPVSSPQPEIFYPNGVEYKCNAGYSENGAPSGPTKLSSRVNSLGQLSPALPANCVRITYMIKGSVKDARNGRSLAGARVSLAGSNQAPQVCALGEGATCVCSGVVHYGLKYVNGKPGGGQTTTFDRLMASPSKQKQVTGQISCSSSAMGGDPLSGYYKWCYCEQAVATVNGLFALTGIGGGSVTLKYHRSGYIDNVKTFNIISNINNGGAADVSMSPKMANDQWRAVVKWKRTPSDLDTYAKWSNTKVCYYSTNRRSVGMQGRLEKDDTNGYGPETIYFTGVGSCRASDNNCYIRYIINDYTRSGRMKDISGAQVTLYTGDRVAGTWTIEGCKNTVSTNGNWWHVFTLDGKRNQLKWNCNSGPEFPSNPGYLSLAHFGPPKPNATQLVAQLSDAVVATLHTNSTSQMSTAQDLERQQEQERLQLERKQAKDKKDMEDKQAKAKKELELREAKAKEELEQAKAKKEAETKRKSMVAAIAALKAAGMEELEKEATAKLAAFDNSSSTSALKPKALLQEPNGVRMHLRSWSKARL